MASFRNKLFISTVLVALMLFEYSASQDITPGELHYTVLEETEAGTIIGDIKADSALVERYPARDLENLQFQFLLNPELSLDLEVQSGVLLTGGRIDRDVTCVDESECIIRLDVVVTNQPHMLEIVKVVIEILDINDNDPYFVDPVVVLRVPESADIDSSFVLPVALDADSGIFGVKRYNLVSNTSKFELSTRESFDGSLSLRLVLRDTLDRERVRSYSSWLVAYDGGSPVRSGSAEIRVEVQDANDNDPLFDNSTYDISVVENVEVGSKVLQVHARDRDTGMYGEVVYSLSSRTQSAYGDIFRINNHTGEIFVSGIVDHEQHDVIHLAIVAHDRGPNSVPAEAMVVIHVIDVNDNAPEITVNTIAAPGTDRAEVQEDAMVGTFVAYVTVTDPDSNDNGRFDCSLDNDVFALQRRFVGEYQVVTTTALNRERSSVFQLDITCRDHGRQALDEVKTIFVHVRDVNDQTPTFTRVTYEGSVPENDYVGTNILTVNATDGDSGTNAEISYHLGPDAGTLFHIDDQTGQITAHAVFDRETKDTYTFTVLAVDHGTPSNTGTATVEVSIMDVNDEQPKFEDNNFSFGVFENEDEGTEVGRVTAIDGDAFPYNDIVYSFITPYNSDAQRHFAIDPDTGTIYTTAELNRELQSVYTLTVSATDQGSPPLSSTASVSIFVADRNDHAPQWIYPVGHNRTVSISPQTPVGYIIATVKASDEDMGLNGNLTYNIVRGNDDMMFKMNKTSGQLAIRKSLSYIEYQLFDIQVMSIDQGFPSQRSLAELHVIVNKSLIFETRSLLLGGQNFIVVVSIAGASLTIVIILVVAIILVCARSRKRETHKYNCRTEALKKDIERGDDPASRKELAAMQMHDGNTTIKNTHADNIGIPSDGTTTIGRGVSSPPPVSPHYTSPHHPVPVPVWVQNARNHHHEHQYLRSPRTIVVGDPLDVMETDSAYSGDGSNTDSGRGASEEGGENHHNGVVVPGVNSQTPAYLKGGMGTANDPQHNTNASSPMQVSPPGGKIPSSPGGNRCQSPYTEVPIVTHRNYDAASLTRGVTHVATTPTKKLHTFSSPQHVTTNGTATDQWRSTDKLVGTTPKPSRNGVPGKQVVPDGAGCHGYQNYEYVSVDDKGSKLSVPDVVPDDVSSTSGSYTVDDEHIEGAKIASSVKPYCRSVVV